MTQEPQIILLLFPHSFPAWLAQSLDTDVQRPFYAVVIVALLPYYGKRTTVATLNKKGVAYR